MISVIVGKVAGLIFKIALANMLGGTGMGYFSSAYAVFTPLYALCAASLTPAVAQLVSENDARGNLKRVRGVKTAALRIFSVPGILCSVVPMVFAGFITKRFIGNEGAKLAVIAILPCVFLGTVTAIYRGYYEGLRNMTPTALSQITESAVRVISGIGFAAMTQKYSLSQFMTSGTVFGTACRTMGEMQDVSLPYVAAAAILGVTASEISSFLFMLIRCRFGGDGIDKSTIPESYEIKSEGKKLMALIIPISAAGIVASLAGTVDLYTIIVSLKSSLAHHPELYVEKYADIISDGVSLKELPNYLYGSFTGLACTVFGLAPSLCSVFGKSALPNISEAWAQKNMSKVRKEIRRVMTITLYIALPAGLGLSAMARPVLNLLFSSRIHEVEVSAEPLMIMALGTAFSASAGAAYAMLQAVGRTDLPIVFNLAGAAVRLLLNTVLIPIPSLGIKGAAIASLASGAMMFLCSVTALYRITETKPQLFTSVVIPLLGGLIASLGALYIKNTSSNYLSEPVSVCFSVVFAVISYIIFVLLLDISTKNKIKKEILGK